MLLTLEGRILKEGRKEGRKDSEGSKEREEGRIRGRKKVRNCKNWTEVAGATISGGQTAEETATGKAEGRKK